VVCYQCNQKGHNHISLDYCTTQHNGERDRERKNECNNGAGRAAQKQENIPNNTFHVGGGSGDSAWIRDSGAPRWYSWDKSVFVNFKPIMDGKEEYCHGVMGDGAKIEGWGLSFTKQSYPMVLRPRLHRRFTMSQLSR
jgi:hypothetical protein